MSCGFPERRGLVKLFMKRTWKVAPEQPSELYSRSGRVPALRDTVSEVKTRLRRGMADFPHRNERRVI